MLASVWPPPCPSCSLPRPCLGPALTLLSLCYRPALTLLSPCYRTVPVSHLSHLFTHPWSLARYCCANLIIIMIASCVYGPSRRVQQVSGGLGDTHTHTHTHTAMIGYTWLDDGWPETPSVCGPIKDHWTTCGQSVCGVCGPTHWPKTPSVCGPIKDHWTTCGQASRHSFHSRGWHV